MNAPRLGGSGSKPKGEEVDSKFDPEQLEKGAAALKEIDGSRTGPYHRGLKHYKHYCLPGPVDPSLCLPLRSSAWPDSKERTQQKAALLEMEKQRTARSQLEEQTLAAQAEESRRTQGLQRTISHLADQERLTAQHKAEVESSLQGRKLELQKAPGLGNFALSLSLFVSLCLVLSLPLYVY
eukprot:s1680_g10.t1